MSKQPRRALHRNSQHFQNANHLPQSTQHMDFYMLRINLREKKKFNFIAKILTQLLKNEKNLF